ncbi:MAG TPA: pyridoxamine 5'-phosphate oxidase [Balneolales bacterium]|nr:pyridoxamine 5'-phosphate oxidase [Balneolales bacterium]
MDRDISSLRREYNRDGLLEKDLDDNPVVQFDHWFQDSLKAGLKDANAMSLSTTGENNRPSSRIVLLKEFDEQGFVFFTNYRSRKGSEIEANFFGALLFYWSELERQVRIEGSIDKVNRDISESYFHSRPVESQLGAVASEQSQMLKNREELESKYQELKKKYEGREIPCPDFWGGYRLRPDRIEFWQGRPSRLHDRFEYIREGDRWIHRRLYP